MIGGHEVGGAAMALDETAGRPPAASVAEATLKPSMHGFGALLITLSCLSPSIGVFVVGSDVIHQAGTSIFLCFLAAALLGVAMAAVYGELASAYPQTGGEYTILGKALGRGWGVAALGINLLGFSLAQSLAGLGVATYLSVLAPGLPAVPTAAVLVMTVTGIALLNIRTNAWITGIFLAAELTALAALALLGFLHPHRTLAAALFHPVVLGSHGELVPASLALAGAATAGGIYAFNGYGSVVFLGEELHEAPRRIARVVYLALGLAVLTELLPVMGLLIGAPDLRALLSAHDPAPFFIAVVGGPWMAKAMSVGVALAIFNAMIAVALMGGRQLYGTGRDRLWPEAVSRAVARIHPRFGSPWIATLIMGTAAVIGCFVDPRLLVLVLGNGNVALYAGLCAAVLMGRRSGATAHAGYRMPLYPLAPLLALAALIAVVWFDLHDAEGAKGLIATAVVVLASLAYYAAVLRRRTVWAYRGPGLGMNDQ
jgi:amino acid transporter